MKIQMVTCAAIALSLVFSPAMSGKGLLDVGGLAMGHAADGASIQNLVADPTARMGESNLQALTLGGLAGFFFYRRRR